MSKATLVAEFAPELGEGWRRLVLDCRHATTTAHTITPPQSSPLGDAVTVRLLLLKHHAEEGCACTRELRRRYGLARTW